MGKKREYMYSEFVGQIQQGHWHVTLEMETITILISDHLSPEGRLDRTIISLHSGLTAGPAFFVSRYKYVLPVSNALPQYFLHLAVRHIRKIPMSFSLHDSALSNSEYQFYTTSLLSIVSVEDDSDGGVSQSHNMDENMYARWRVLLPPLIIDKVSSSPHPWCSYAKY